MPIPIYPKQLAELLRKNEAGIANTADSSYEADQSVIREMRVQDSLEKNDDPNDMPLEIAKNNEANPGSDKPIIGPIDTEYEIKKLKSLS
ncbi:hypothetical protein [Legionella tunisiensis]|uniref:hypothetical protein n=1 Tax=Legionella tunisiensis TaxID=1034944 RepID=UPI0002EE6FE7|nr:hypothetical protein [Legionella tunisiensis]